MSEGQTYIATNEDKKATKIDHGRKRTTTEEKLPKPGDQKFDTPKTEKSHQEGKRTDDAKVRRETTIT